MAVYRYAHSLLWISPNATKDEIADQLFVGEAVQGEFLCRVSTIRKRRPDATGRRKTVDWRIGYFLGWPAGVLALAAWQRIFAEAKAQRINEIIVYGRQTTIFPTSRPERPIEFVQFGVRDLAELPEC